MVDKSWGVAGATGVRAETNDLGRRHTDRADARASRSTDRAAAMARRQEERAARRDADTQVRDQERAQRHEEQQQAAATDPHAAAAQRRRASGRRDLVREQRDTSGYTMTIDADRLRALAGRGASVASLSSVFGITAEEVEQALNDGGTPGA
jgi:hypothetical protein